MNAVAHNPLPLATTSALTPRSSLPDPVPGAAWSVAFDRAAHELRTVLAPARSMEPVPQYAGSPLADHTVQLASTSAAMKAAMQPVLHTQGVQHEQARNVVMDRTAAALPRSDQEPAPTMDATQRGATRPAEDRAPVRMHIEHQGDGVAIWIGCDARVSPIHVAALLEAVKSQCAVTAPVVSVVCNGTPVYARNHHPQESP